MNAGAIDIQGALALGDQSALADSCTLNITNDHTLYGMLMVSRVKCVDEQGAKMGKLYCTRLRRSLRLSMNAV